MIKGVTGLRVPAYVEDRPLSAEQPMRLRTGRRNHRNLYLQLGAEPSDDDVCLGLIIDTSVAAVIVDCVNKYGVPRVSEAAYTGPHRIRHAVIGSEGCCG